MYNKGFVFYSIFIEKSQSLLPQHAPPPCPPTQLYLVCHRHLSLLPPPGVLIQHYTHLTALGLDH